MARLTRTISGRILSGCILGALLAAAPAGARQPATPDLSLVGALPGDVDLVVAARGLRRLRETPAGQAVERLLASASSWARTKAAVASLAEVLGADVSNAPDRLVGEDALLAVRGSDGRRDRVEHALISEIDQDTERLLRSRLNPTPRTVAEGAPVMTLENGAFLMSIGTERGPDGRTRLLCSPRGADGLFDDMLPLVAARTASKTLSASAIWPSIKRVEPGPVFILNRRGAPGAAESDFVAISLRAEGELCHASFVGSPGMLLGHEAPAGPLRWPSATVERMKQGALLMVAGSTQAQPELGAPELAAPRTILQSLLSVFELPEGVRAHASGVAVVSLHEHATRSGDGLSVTGVIPLESWGDGVRRIDRWLISLAAGTPEGVDAARRVAKAPATQLRMLTVGPVASGLGGYLRAGGTISWAFRQDGADPARGWWIVNVWTHDDSDLAGAEVVEHLVEDLGAGSDDHATMFRLSLRPAELAAALERRGRMLSGDKERGVKGPAAPVSPIMWIASVESVVGRAPDGLLVGSADIRFSPTGAPGPPTNGAGVGGREGPGR